MQNFQNVSDVSREVYTWYYMQVSLHQVRVMRGQEVLASSSPCVCQYVPCSVLESVQMKVERGAPHPFL